jgi:response regulator RpfG family c-di-GMP phosphodiesterase
MMPTFPAKERTTNDTASAPVTHRSVQKVVVVNSSSEILAMAEGALTAGNYDVVLVEAIAHAYSQIRRVQPNLVILCLRIGDGEAFRLLSMLKLDPDTRNIPVLTYAAEDDPQPSTDIDDETREFFAHRTASRMN